MRMKAAALSAMVLAGLALTGCGKSNDRQLQGWVEAELIFVSPDEQGRVETLKVREGDRVKKGDLLFTVDDDLQKADVVVKKTAVINAQQNFDRAKQLLLTSTGTQKNFDDAEAALRQANANLEWSKTRLARRSAYSPADGTIEQVYYRPGETVPAGKPVVALLPPQNLKMQILCAGAGAAADQIRREARRLLRRLRKRADREGQFHRPQRRIHPAGDLQPR